MTSHIVVEDLIHREHHVFITISTLFFTLTLICPLAKAAFGTQRVKVWAKLMCGERPYAGAQVKLVDKNLFKDTNMDSLTTDGTGVVKIEGTSTALVTIDPMLKIYHRCNEKKILGILPKCPRRWAFEIPSKYVSGVGTSANDTQVFKLGVVNLEAIIENERTDCIH